MSNRIRAREALAGQELRNCPRCGKSTFASDPNGGEVYCTNCGYVMKERIEEVGPEWRTFSEDGTNNSRVGAPSTIVSHDMGLATVIGSLNKDAGGTPVSGAMRSTLDRMRTWDRRSQVAESSERNMRQAFNQLRMFAEKLSVSEEVIERAAYIYRKALEKGLLRGRSITQMISGSLYAACRDMQVPRTLKDVCAVSNVQRKDLSRSYRLILKEMDIRMPVPNPTKSIARIASNASVSEKTKRRALEILVKAQQREVIAGKDPMGLAAAALYMASTLTGEAKTQKELARAASVTEVTVRSRYKGLIKALGVEPVPVANQGSFASTS